MASVTQTPRTQFFTGPGTVTEIAPGAGLTNFSLHDCMDPAQVSVMNCIWPIGVLGGGSGVSFKTGLVVHSRNATTVTVRVSKA